MEIDFSQKICNLKGEALKDPQNKMAEITLGDVCINALLAPTQEKIDGKEKLNRWRHARRIEKGGKMTFNVDTIAKLKKLINAAYPSPIIVGQAWIMLDSAEKETEENVENKTPK